MIPARAAATAFRLSGLLRLWAGGGATARPMSAAVALTLEVISRCRLRCVGALLRPVLLLLVAKASLADQWSAAVGGAVDVTRRATSRH